jgi:hypothetical protein
MTDKNTTEKSLFMQVYYSDPEYKKKHNSFMMELITCDCGQQIMRCNKSHHKKAKRHKFAMNLFSKSTPEEIEKYLEIEKEFRK